MTGIQKTAAKAAVFLCYKGFSLDAINSKKL